MCPAPVTSAAALRVVVVGDVATDIVARAAEPVADRSDAAASVVMGRGGAGANVASWLAAAGVPVALVGRVGDDQPGRDQAAALRAAGIAVHLAVDGTRPTGAIVVVVEPGGERTMLADRGANLAFAVADVPAALFVAGRHLHLSGYALLDAGPRPAALHALERARAGGMTVSIDPASWRPLARCDQGAFLDWTRGADLCLPNRDEARVLADTDDPAAAARLLARDYGAAVVSAGPDGAYWSDGTDLVHAPAVATRVVDTTGAGDACTAGYLAAWLEGGDPLTCLQAAMTLAARAVATHGATPV